MKMSGKSDSKGSLVCLKYSLCLYNFIFLLSGCVVCGLGLWTVLDSWDLVSMTPSLVYQVTVWLAISAGCVSVLVSLLGYSAVAFESSGLLAWYTILLLLIFMLESVIGLVSYVYQDNLQAELTENLKEKFVNPYSLQLDQTLAVDRIQEKYECCGAASYLDWADSAWSASQLVAKVPDSCCKSPGPRCGARDHPSNIHYTGCVHRFQASVSGHLSCICLASVCVALLQVAGTLLTSCLFSALHRRDKYAPAPGPALLDS